MNKKIIAATTLSNSGKNKFSTILLLLLVGLLTGQQLQAQTRIKPPPLNKSAVDIQTSSPRILRKILDPSPIQTDKLTASDHEQITAPSAEGDVDTTFNGGVTEGTGAVEKTVVQPDGKIIVGGSFRGVNGSPRNSLARINADGSLDATFNPAGAGPNADIYALALQADGKILIGGNGAVYNGAFVGTVARLNADGTPDLSFNLSGNSADGIVETIAVQPDGKILIGGLFSAFNDVPRANLARLNADGTLDTTFTPGIFNDPVLSIVVQPDGKILASGIFRQYNGSSVGSLIRLNADGSLDAGFNTGSGANTPVEAIALQPDGKVLVGGYFTLFNGTATPLGFVRLNANGTIENTFSFPGISSSISAIGLLSDGTILLGGTVRVVTPNGTTTTRGISVISSAAPTFQSSNSNGDILDINVQPDGKVLVGGNFTQYNGGSNRRLTRLNTDGSTDSSFQTIFSTAGIVKRIVVLANGKTLVGGDFQFVNGVSKKQLARLNADGSIDTSFNVSAASLGDGSAVSALFVQPDGKILVGTIFVAANGISTNRVVRLNADGSLDSTFVYNQNTLAVNDFKLLPDGKILVGGLFNLSGGLRGIIRLNSNGSLDSSFNSFVTSAPVQTITFAADGKIFVGGRLNVTVAAGVSSRGAVKINADGSIDPSFAFRSNTASSVNAIAVLADGRILLGGSLVNLSNVRRSVYRVFPNGDVDPTFNQTGTGASGTIQSLAIQSDGKILIGGFFTIYNSVAAVRIARLNTDGTLDTTFSTGAGANDVVNDIALQSDGKILLGGNFTTFNNQPRQGLVRLNGSAVTRRTQFDFDGDGKSDVSVFRPSNGTWYLQQSQSGFTGVAFGVSTDKIVPADYDGDGKTDVAVYRDGNWYLQRSNLGFTGAQFGEATDIPVPADFDADGKADLAVFRPSNGTWFIQRSQAGFTAVQFGSAGDKPIAADFDGDGKSDLAVFRPSDGIWYVLQSTAGFTGLQFGSSEDKLVVADYDGDGKADYAVYRPSTGFWYLQLSQLGFTGVQFGISTDIPVPADYDGDGKTDIGVYRNDTWLIQRSTSGFTGVQFGGTGDQPAPNAFVR